MSDVLQSLNTIRIELAIIIGLLTAQYIFTVLFPGKD